MKNALQNSCAVALACGVGLMSGCGNQDTAFNIAKSKTWGDKYNGCDYQQIKVTDNNITLSNSQRRIGEISSMTKGATGTPVRLNETQNITFQSVDSDGAKFTVFDENKQPLAKFSVKDSELLFESLYVDGAWKQIPRKKGIGNQATFVSC